MSAAAAASTTTTSSQKQQSAATRNEIQSKQHITFDKMAKRRMQKPVVDTLVLSTSSGYSTASEEAEPQSDVTQTIPTPIELALTHRHTSPAEKISSVSAPQKSSKRKTRAPTAPIAPSQKRLKVESITNYNCNSTTAAQSSSSMHHSIDGTVLSSKPPLPSKATSTSHSYSSGDTRSNHQSADVRKTTKRHSDNNQKQAALLNKLSAYADQCRLEIADLKLALANEKAAVRSLR